MSSGESPIDIVYGKGGKRAPVAPASPLDELILARQRRMVLQAQENDAKIYGLNQQKDLLAAEAEVNRLRDQVGGGGGGGPTNPELALVKEFVKEGMEIGKATDMISKMSPMQRLQLMTLAQSKGGAAYMAPFMAAASQPETSVDSALRLMEKAQEMAEKRMPAPSADVVDQFTKMYNIMKPGEQQQGQFQYLADRQERLQAQLQDEREARHQSELVHANELASIRQQNLENQLKVLDGKLEEVLSEKTKTKDPLAQFKDTVETLKTLGMPIAVGAEEVGAKSPMQEANEIIKTVMDSPGIDKVTTALSDRIRERGFRGPQPSIAARTPGGLPPGQQILCDVCLSQGRKTPLPITPGLIAGTESVICPVCHTSFKKGGGVQPSQGQPPGPPPPPSGGPPQPPPYFPGKF